MPLCFECSCNLPAVYGYSLGRPVKCTYHASFDMIVVARECCLSTDIMLIE